MSTQLRTLLPIAPSLIFRGGKYIANLQHIRAFLLVVITTFGSCHLKKYDNDFCELKKKYKYKITNFYLIA
jgi:hypothetical protein